MAVAIKLMRTGKRGHATYRVVVMDKKKKRNGSYIEKIGTYDPHAAKTQLDIDKEKFNQWLTKGAVVSEGIRKLLHLIKS